MKRPEHLYPQAIIEDDGVERQMGLSKLGYYAGQALPTLMQQKPDQQLRKTVQEAFDIGQLMLDQEILRLNPAYDE